MFKFKKKSTKQQSGRSMVEMLGVLAIIGVLSIGGIAGYTLSMRKYRANQIVDALNKYALFVYEHCQKALIDGDITGIKSCYAWTATPSYDETGLPPISDIDQINMAFVVTKEDTDFVYMLLFFKDATICNATRSITGLVSTQYCNEQNIHYYMAPFKIN